MVPLFVPTLHTFANGNKFTGSFGLLRFKITPNIVKATPKEVDFAASSMTGEVWHGIFCYEKSTIEETREFPLTDQGREDLIAWLESHI